MLAYKLFVNVSLFMGFVGCGVIYPKRAATADNPKQQVVYERIRTQLEFYPSEETGLVYSSQSASPNTNIFLVAGSLRGANFAQEILDQKKLWLERGATEDQIACYYVIPDKKNFDGDREQYSALAPDLGQCKIASMKILIEDLRSAAQSKPEHIYLYVTSHGDRPLSYYAAKAEQEQERSELQWLLKTYPELDRYMIALDSTPSGSASTSMQLDAIDAGTPADEIFLTPNSLNAALAMLNPDVRKTVVIQGCYSGGFVVGASPDQEILGKTPAITVLTAARNDRPSFGCGLADKTTYFGGAVLDALNEESRSLPHEIDWESIYKAARAKVEQLEAKEGYKPSEPVFFSNR